jgi:surfactin synthase thioesterase subunit
VGESRPGGSAASSWVLRPRQRSDNPRLRLFCFPYAGAAASAYREWPAALGPEIEVLAIQLPGRGARFREPPFERCADLAAAAASGLAPLLDEPFAFFGHSMGALVAFELTRELRRQGRPGPALLAVSGRQGPQRPEPHPPYSHLPDAEFVAEVVTRYGGIPDEVLAEKDLLRLLIPALRADVGMLEHYEYVAEAPLACPLVCLGGLEDPEVSLADLEAWRDETRAACAVRTFAGGHFFIDSARAEVAQVLREQLLLEVCS